MPYWGERGMSETLDTVLVLETMSDFLCIPSHPTLKKDALKHLFPTYSLSQQIECWFLNKLNIVSFHTSWFLPV